MNASAALLLDLDGTLLDTAPVMGGALSRTPRAYLMAVLGAEYVLPLLPPGPHSSEQFIRPSELAGWSRAAGLELVDVMGLDYEPFSRNARLVPDASVNYLMHLRRSPAGAAECCGRRPAAPGS